jgi:dihydroxy-acid dehydratase
MGYSREDFAGKPVIAIINTWSDINQCHSHSGQSAEEVKRDTWRPAFPRELEAGNPAVPLAPQLLQ